MKVSELRIGNLIYSCDILGNKKEAFEVTPRFFSSLAGGKSFEEQREAGYELLNNYLQPIPLTEEWLVKFGFELLYNEYSLWGRGKWQITRTRNEYHKSTGHKDIDEYWRLYISHKSHDDMPKFKYVHQLQNLYFALTGEELTIK